MRITRWDPWERGTDLAVVVSDLVDDDGVAITSATLTVLVAAAGDTQPPVAFGSRVAVPLTYDEGKGRWRGIVPYGADLDVVDAVRLVVAGTVAGRAVRPLECEARFVLADGR